MALQTKLVQKMGQNLLMTPQLQQAIKLLQLDRFEYEQAIKKELIENPVLEEVPYEAEISARPSAPAEPNSPLVMGDSGNDGNSDTPPQKGQEAKSDWDDYSDSFTDYKGSAGLKGSSRDENRQLPEIPDAPQQSLESHLLQQLRMADLTDQEKQIAQYVIGNLDDDGYLRTPLEEIAEAAECEVSEIEPVIETLKYFDPPGICSRSLRECLLTQLEALGQGESLAAKIVDKHLERIEKRKVDQILNLESVELEQVSKAVDLIKSLEPRPGRLYSDDSARYIIPDVYVYKVGAEYVTVLNEDGLPKLRVNPTYESMMKNDVLSNAQANKAYMSEKVRSAQWLIRSIYQRQQTILKVTESIMRFQRDFLDYGTERMKPLVLKDVADDIGMHESTVSRVTTEKYVHTPQGVFELKFFFTSGIKSGTGGDVSSFSVKERIRQLISEESKEKPVSDQELVELLKRENVDIARRTVAKYRENLGIPGSSQRKKLF